MTEVIDFRGVKINVRLIAKAHKRDFMTTGKGLEQTKNTQLGSIVNWIGIPSR
jgi:hypothetical protein